MLAFPGGSPTLRRVQPDPSDAPEGVGVIPDQPVTPSPASLAKGGRQALRIQKKLIRAWENLPRSEATLWALRHAASPILTTLANERSAIGGGGGIKFDHLAALARTTGRTEDPLTRQELAKAYTRYELIRYVGYRVQTALSQGRPPGPESSTLKLAYSQHLAATADLVLPLLGAPAARLLGKAVFTALRVLDTATITHPAPGSPIGMEWWHFQRTDLVSQAKTFGKLLLELGWTDEGLLDTPSSTTYGRTGVGYPRSELDKVVG